MSEKKPVYVFSAGNEPDTAGLVAILASLECVELVASEAQARFVLVLAADLPTGAELQRLIMGAAQRFRLIGVTTGSTTVVPDPLRVVAWTVVGVNASELHDVICLEKLPSGGGDGFPPKGHPCGHKG